MQRSKLFGALVGTACACALGLVSSAQAADGWIYGGDLQAVRNYTIGSPSGGPEVVTAGAVYSNRTNFSGSAIPQTVVANAGGTTGDITNMIMDDITPVAGNAGVAITQMSFSVYNGNTTTLAARARIRFWNADGAGGGPGTYYSNPAAIGYTFNLFAFDPGVTILTGNLGAGFPLPAGRFWAGITFDNNAQGGVDLDPTGMGNGPFVATGGELALFGQGLFGVPDVGTSANEIFTTTAAGSFFGTANPAGVRGPIGGTNPPLANTGWEFVAVPEPSALGLIGLAALGMGARRRKA